jgi:regulator of sirC expression with transglutaminase-like and TPR domain
VLDRQDYEIDMLRSALLIAQHRNADLDIAHYTQMIEKMAHELEAHLPPPDERYPLRMIKAISKYIYGAYFLHLW